MEQDDTAVNLFEGNSDATESLLQQVDDGVEGALDALFAHHRPFLRRFVQLRIDGRLRQRVDPSDVVQEAQIEASRRVNDFLIHPAVPFRLWLRQIAYDRLLMLRRRHLGAQRRSIERESPLIDQSSVQLAQQLVADGSSPSEHFVRGELVRRVRQALERLGEMDREVVIMRSIEGLSNQEVALVLGVDPATASKRYGRALLRLRTLLVESGLSEAPQ